MNTADALQEKADLEAALQTPQDTQNKILGAWWRQTKTWILLLFVACLTLQSFGELKEVKHGHKSLKAACSQAKPLIPSNSSITSSLNETLQYINGDNYRAHSQGLLSKAVTYPTVSYDDLGLVSGEHADERWATREPFIGNKPLNFVQNYID
jgi:cytochrome c-type biogenesis protein CcmH/NrfG